MRTLCIGLSVALAMACGKGASKDRVAPVAETAGAGAAPVKGEIVSEEVSFPVGRRTIAGTLTRPAAAGRHPAVLLHAGSGPTDRDWNNPGMPGTNGSGKLLAEELSAVGFVVLRYDKLGTGKTTLPPELTWEAVLDDARGGLAMLRGRSDVDPSKIFLAGHSEGGPHMLRLAASEKQAIAGLVLLACPGRSMGDLLIVQVERDFIRNGVTGAALAAEMKPFRSALARFFAGQDVQPREASKHQSLQMLVAGLFNPVAAGYAREFYDFDPRRGIAKVAVPLLIWNGGKDIQVSHEDDAVGLRAAAVAAGRDATIHISADADHVIKHQPKPLAELSPMDALQYNADGRVLDHDAVAGISRWLRERAGLSR